jgi:hypothetical protein
MSSTGISRRTHAAQVLSAAKQYDAVRRQTEKARGDPGLLLFSELFLADGYWYPFPAAALSTIPRQAD